MADESHSENPDVTQLLVDASRGDSEALKLVFPIVYEELKRTAHAQRRSSLPSDTLATTALVHEAYIKLVEGRPKKWEGRSHFFGVAAKAMRSILVDRVRAFRTRKRGGGWERLPLDDVVDALHTRGLDVIALNDALERLSEIDARSARLVELKYFAGLPLTDIAVMQGVSQTTAERDWEFARAWLRRGLAGPSNPP